MRPAKAFPRGATEKLRVALQQAKTKSNFQRVQCLWLRAALGLDANQVAIAIGWQPSSVRRLHAQYLHEGEDILSTVGRGGRRHQNLAEEEEAQLLSQFAPRAERGGMLEVSQIKRVYEKAIGHSVPKSTVYRMLSRHGWRKIAPRPRHPRVNLRRQQEFKKN